MLVLSPDNVVEVWRNPRKIPLVQFVLGSLGLTKDRLEWNRSAGNHILFTDLCAADRCSSMMTIDK